MQFLSLEFLASVAALFALYWLVPRRSWQNSLLTLASLGFLSLFGVAPLVVLVVSTTLEWAIALRLGATDSRNGRRALVALSVLLNLAQLAWFKYGPYVLPPLGLSAVVLKAAVPVGLSFWTLQKMTLTLDVYYRRQPPERNLLRCLLFVSFFPAVLSGPIERAHKLLPQFAEERRWDTRRFSEAVWLIVLGAFHKAVIADNIAVCADSLLKPGSSGLAILVGIWAYAIQIYGDFAGYSYMARGFARLYGIDLTQNFLAPYFTTNLSDFWKHWHISLSGWLTEFIFSPVSMALRRHGTAAVLAATWATFAASGLWHGTGWTYVWWGAIHASGWSVWVLTKPWRKIVKTRYGKQCWPQWVAIFLTFHWVCLGYVFFRAPTSQAALDQISQLFRGSWNPLALSVDWPILVACASAAMWLQWSISRSRNVFWIFERSVRFRMGFYLALLMLLLRFYAPSERFIYFQF